jgi:hypothetical protein
VVFSSLYGRAGIVFLLCHGLFFPNPFRYIIQLSSYHSTLYSIATGSVVKYRPLPPASHAHVRPECKPLVITAAPLGSCHGSDAWDTLRLSTGPSNCTSIENLDDFILRSAHEYFSLHYHVFVLNANFSLRSRCPSAVFM